ncbi:glycosyltransferase family 4 protein [Hoylesella loescheii]|uniref:Glycosyltransferase, group 1 family protein n=1 Tax=Hoylesella loescheii DSM 19665 = JCM 12249 = ATCC 15930 TaxID=1122985 RepID=A0A069QNM9_HOYLO|nr:glycosyltransferase family 4 protein [Hoylesella loescheii]KDR51456.1 glycosyltransferase, group 1 family protein [Hoylesella loescheii DSM 19665 = JCM 12249 = ATCC 15930]
MKKKLIRVTTSDISLDTLIKGQLHFMNQHYEVVGLSNNTGRLMNVSEREGVRVIEVPMHREISLGADLKCLWKLCKIFKRERPFIVHANTPKGSLLAMMAGKLTCVPHRIYTVTGLRYQGAQGMLRWILMTMERITCFCATKVIPEGNGVKMALEHDHITKKPLKVVLNGNINGIDTEYFSAESVARVDETQPTPTDVANKRAAIRASLGLSADDFAFVFVGRIVGDKGMNELAACMRQLQGSHPKCKLILVGRFETEFDPLDNGIEDFFKSASNVVYVGYQKDVRPYFLVADALVFPSYREGFPNVVMQAGSMKLPSIVTDINGCNEIVTDGINGKIIPPRDSEALLKMMENFLDDLTATNSMARNARTIIQSRYEQRQVWEALREEYGKLN